MKKKQINRNEKLELCIGILLVCVILLIVFFFLNYFYHCKQYESSIEQMQEISSTVFSLNNIILYSSAGAFNHSSSSLLNLDISQFTDIAIFINNNANGEYTLKNTIKELYIDSISFSPLPQQGTPSLFLKDLNTFGKIIDLSDRTPLQDSFSFPVVESKDQVDFANYEIASTCSTPIVLEYINQNIKTNYHLPLESTQSFDGSVLKKAGISFSNIETNLSFRIHIINRLEEHFVCNVYIGIPLRDDSNTHTIYDGSFIKELDHLQNYTFLRQID